jgi:formylglycine-generating enzyme required for sulfatase activity
LLCELLKQFTPKKSAALSLLALFVATLCAPPSAAAVTIDWVTVGDPGNPAAPVDGSNYLPGDQFLGAVDHAYKIGKYDVTVNQYVEFLNSNDPTGANTLGLYAFQMSELYGGLNFNPAAIVGAKYSAVAGRENRPIAYVTWYNAARFANWLNNGQVPGSTETGAYTLLGGTARPSDPASIRRSVDASVFLPSLDEWYKAAYYDTTTDSYNYYPTSSKTPPTHATPTSLPNTANIEFGSIGNTTDVGAYSGTTSPSGAYDMAGNLYQWTETGYPYQFGDHPVETFRHVRGGYWGSYVSETNWREGYVQNPFVPLKEMGFRVAAAVPEPSTFALLLSALAGSFIIGCRRRVQLRARSSRR